MNLSDYGNLLRLSRDFPIVFELVDTEEKLKSFLASIDHALGKGLATFEKVNILFYRSSEK